MAHTMIKPRICDSTSTTVSIEREKTTQYIKKKIKEKKTEQLI